MINMKNVFKYIFVLIFIFMINVSVSAKTVKDLKNELAKYQSDLAAAKNKKKLTEKEISNVNSRVKEISDTIIKDQDNIKKTEDEIVELEKKTKEKEVEIKDVIAYIQIQNSENAYLEYIFGSKSVEDLIIRSAVSEQMVDYNDTLIEEYNNTIVKFKQKTEDLKVQITNLNKEQDNLADELVKLGDNLEAAVDASVSAESEIKLLKDRIAYYEKIGCKDDENINTCGKIPYSGKMIRPLNSGYVSSEYGMRYHPTQHVYKLHTGIDLTGGSYDVYAVAPGTVAGISWKNSCGGTMLFVHHNINGKYYTSVYQHLYQVLVKANDYVDQNTKIAVAGGNNKNASWGGYTPWDSCSTGRHLHLTIGNCLYLDDSKCKTYSKFTSHLVNPRTMVNFPKKGVRFNNRTTLY